MLLRMEPHDETTLVRQFDDRFFSGTIVLLVVGAITWVAFDRSGGLLLGALLPLAAASFLIQRRQRDRARS
jgi:hypothetical protein